MLWDKRFPKRQKDGKRGMLRLRMLGMTPDQNSLTVVQSQNCGGAVFAGVAVYETHLVSFLCIFCIGP